MSTMFLLTIHSNINKTSTDVLKADSVAGFRTLKETAEHMRTYLLTSQMITITDADGEILVSVIGMVEMGV